MPNKYKKLPDTCTLHLMSIVFWRALTTSQPFNFKASKTSSASSTAPPCKGHPAAGMDPLLRSEAWFVRRMLKRTQTVSASSVCARTCLRQMIRDG